jgi:type IV secretion system protein VirB9
MIVGLLSAIAMASLPVQFGSPPLMTDARIQVVSYVADQVVPLRVATGYAAVVEFAADERIENVVVGNSAAWQVTANGAGDRLVVKPLTTAATTNMVVITTVRRYVFLLEAGSDGTSAFVLRFTYPALPSPLVSQSLQTATYRLRGAKKLFPIAMSDDGRRTTITWDRKISQPAIFAIDDQGKEALVNGRMIDGDYVVEGTASRYILRLGKERATAQRQPIGAGK